MEQNIFKKEIDKVIKQAYENGVKDGINKVINEKEDNKFLSEGELKTFNAYIDDCMHDIAFSNSEWVDVYKKITQGRMSEKSIERINSFR